MHDSITWVGMDVHAENIEEPIDEESRNPELAPTVARLRTLRGVDTITAMTVVSEVIDLNRFASPRELMAFIGLVPRERSSGGKERRGSITKTGNAHLRRVLIESAWHCQRLSRVPARSIQVRRQGQPAEIVEIARKAERRLHKKYARMIGRGKPSEQPCGMPPGKTRALRTRQLPTDHCHAATIPRISA